MNKLRTALEQALKSSTSPLKDPIKGLLQLSEEDLASLKDLFLDQDPRSLLGKEAFDSVSNFSGTVTSVSLTLKGSTQVLITPLTGPKDHQWVELTRTHFNDLSNIPRVSKGPTS